MPTASVRRACGYALVATLLCAAAGSPRAQSRLLVDDPGVWKPWKPFSAVASTRTDRGATPAEVKAFEATLLQLNAILRRAPGVATPRGYSVETWGYLSGYRPAVPGSPAGKSLPLAGGLTFGAFPIFEYERAGKMIRSDTGETALMTFQVNENAPWMIGGQKPVEWGPLDTDGFLQPQPNGQVAGIPRFGDIAVLKNNPASLWIPMSLQPALDLVVTQRENELAERRQEVTTLQKDFDLWKSPAKRAERMAGYKFTAANIPDGAKYLAGVDKQERDLEAIGASQVGPDSPAAKSLRVADAALAEIKTLIGDLSAADREGPGCYAKSATTLRSRFRAGTPAGCHPLGRPNPQFFNASAPRTVAQLVIIGQIARCFDNQPANQGPFGCTANRQLLETLDKQAVLSLLK
jgi:hypothetical protein